MENIAILGDASWRHFLGGRKNFSFFTVPKPIAFKRILRDGAKRRLRLRLPDGRTMAGCCRISVGHQIYIPARFQEAVSSQEWIQFEILDSATGDEAGLEWEQA